MHNSSGGLARSVSDLNRQRSRKFTSGYCAFLLYIIRMLSGLRFLGEGTACSAGAGTFVDGLDLSWNRLCMPRATAEPRLHWSADEVWPGACERPSTLRRPGSAASDDRMQAFPSWPRVLRRTGVIRDRSNKSSLIPAEVWSVHGHTCDAEFLDLSEQAADLFSQPDCRQPLPGVHYGTRPHLGAVRPEAPEIGRWDRQKDSRSNAGASAETRCPGRRRDMLEGWS